MSICRGSQLIVVLLSIVHLEAADRHISNSMVRRAIGYSYSHIANKGILSANLYIPTRMVGNDNTINFTNIPYSNTTERSQIHALLSNMSICLENFELITKRQEDHIRKLKDLIVSSESKIPRECELKKIEESGDGLIPTFPTKTSSKRYDEKSFLAVENFLNPDNGCYSLSKSEEERLNDLYSILINQNYKQRDISNMLAERIKDEKHPVWSGVIQTLNLLNQKYTLEGNPIPIDPLKYYKKLYHASLKKGVRVSSCAKIISYSQKLERLYSLLPEHKQRDISNVLANRIKDKSHPVFLDLLEAIDIISIESAHGEAGALKMNLDHFQELYALSINGQN